MILVAADHMGVGQAAPMLAQAPSQAASSPADAIRAAVVQTELGAPEGSDPFRDASTSSLLSRGTVEPAIRERLIEDAILLDRAMRLGPDALTPHEQQALRDRHGWFADLALTYTLDPDDPEYQRPREQGVSMILVLAGVMTVAGIASLIGLVLVGVASWKLANGRLRSGLDRPTPGGSVYLEIFPVFLAAFLAHQIIATMVHVLAGLIVGDDLAQSIAMWYSLLGQWAIVLVIAWPMVRGVDPKRMLGDLGLHRGKGIVREIGAGIVGYLAGLPMLILAFVLVIVLMAIFSGPDGSAPTPNNPIVDSLQSGSVPLIVALVLLATLWAPLVEEVVFRGGLYRHVRSRLGVPLAALLVGVLFAFMHSYGPIFTPPLIALGVTFALLREWRGSLIASMTAHFIHNAAVLGFAITMSRLGQ